MTSAPTQLQRMRMCHSIHPHTWPRGHREMEELGSNNAGKSRSIIRYTTQPNTLAWLTLWRNACGTSPSQLKQNMCQPRRFRHAKADQTPLNHIGWTPGPPNLGSCATAKSPCSSPHSAKAFRRGTESRGHTHKVIQQYKLCSSNWVALEIANFKRNTEFSKKNFEKNLYGMVGVFFVSPDKMKTDNLKNPDLLLFTLGQNFSKSKDKKFFSG